VNLDDAPTRLPVTLDRPDVQTRGVRRLAELGLRAGSRVTPLHRTAGGARVVGVGSARVAVARTVLSRMGLRDGARGVLRDPATDAEAGLGRDSAAGLGRDTAAGDAAGDVAGDAAGDAAADRSATDQGGAGCHGDHTAAAAPPGSPTIAMVGSPNVGKSTLFNAITGSRRKVGNWPGTSVEVGRCRWRIGTGAGTHAVVDLLDLPGAYSLDPLSPDERLTRTLLLDVPMAERPDLIVIAINAADIARGLYLLSQIREQPVRVVVALTMVDVARRRGTRIEVPTLQDELGVPVVVVDPRRRAGVDALAPAVAAALAGPPPEPVDRTAGLGDIEDPTDLDLADARFDWIVGAVDAAVRRTGPDPITWSDRVDRVVTSRLAGPLVFLAVMWGLFQLTTAGAAPLVDTLNRLVSGPVTTGAASLLGVGGLSGTWIEGLVLDGLVAGVGMVLSFVPLMALMFVLLALLEDSGYLARAAVVADRLMRTIGLPGRAVVPLVVGFGCNVPAISATRVLPDARHRLVTALLVPFTTCSARLPVYVLVSAALFGERSGNVVFGMYLASILLVVVGGLMLRATLLRDARHEPLVLDLPGYQVPMPRVIAAMTWSRLAAFLRTATGIIVLTIMAVWLLSAVPVRGDAGFGTVPVKDSAFGAVAAAVAPAFEPAGFGDWHLTGALVAGFVAKEAVISSLGQTYAAEEPQDLRRPGQLGDSLRADLTASSGGHPRLAGIAFLLFLLGYTPCVATVTAQARELGRRWALISVGLGLAVAWTASVAVFQIGRVFL
jgi:ferrous iron transport protein B